MQDIDRQHVLRDMQRVMKQRREERIQAQELLVSFTGLLFTAFENAAAFFQQAGVAEIGTPRRLKHPAIQDLQMLQLFIEDWSVLLIPLIGVARPALKDEAQIPAARFKEFTGRIAAFLSDDPNGTAFYDFLVFADGSWFAWGYGWPRQHDTIEGTDFEQLAFELLMSFSRDIYTVWRTRSDTVLRQAVDKDRPVFEFRVLRDE